MDSLTHIVLGAAIAGSLVPAADRRVAMLGGAVLATLPDLDGVALALAGSDPVTEMTWHRSATHSLLVLPLAGLLLWWLLRSRGERVGRSPRRWLLAIVLALCTHPLLDALTVYGTQLRWPFDEPPTMWSTLFIIDPAYTIWLVVACLVALATRDAVRARRALLVGIALSSVYLGWSLVAKGLVERVAGPSLAAIGLADAPRLSIASPFNTLLWRVVAMTPDGYVIGDRSLLADRGPMQWRRFASDTGALAQAAAVPALQRLRWFNDGFMRGRVIGDELVVSDLRMGVEPQYTFSFAVARRVDGQWQPITPRRIAVAAYGVEGGVGPAFGRLWRRLFDEHAPGL